MRATTWKALREGLGTTLFLALLAVAGAALEAATSTRPPPAVPAPTLPSALETIGHDRALARAADRALGLDLVRTGRPAEAARLLEPLLQRGADPELCLALAEAYDRTGRRDDAARLLGSLVQDPRAPARALAVLARLQLDPAFPETFRPDDALALAEAAARRGDPCYDVLAACYVALGDREAALDALAAGLSDDDAPPSVREACRALLARLAAP